MLVELHLLLDISMRCPLDTFARSHTKEEKAGLIGAESPRDSTQEWAKERQAKQPCESQVALSRAKA